MIMSRENAGTANAFATALANEFKSNEMPEKTITENGAVMHKTSGKKLLDLNFAVSSLRSASENTIIETFSNAFYENSKLAVKWLFYLRDVRGGMGERRSFRVCMDWLAKFHPEYAAKVVKLIPEYGRWDDLIALISNENIGKDVLDIIFQQLEDDNKNAAAGKNISLLAKWMPSITTSSPKTVALAKSVASKLGMSDRSYRKMLSKLRKHLDVVECKMSSKEWFAINYEHVPSMANLKYKDAFLKNDEARRRKYLETLKTGEAKINSSACFPYDIVSKYGRFYYGMQPDTALEAMWDSLPDYVKGNDDGSTIVVADGSGSMMSCVSSSSNVTALDVANSLAIYFAEHLSGPFKDKYITFSMSPQYVDMTRCSSLAEKLSVAYRHSECANTNVEAVFDLLLNTAVSNKLKQSDLPSNVLVVSDMEFDSCAYSNSKSSRYYGYSNCDATLFDAIADKWHKAGYEMPRLVFWNVCSRTNGIPLRENDFGVALVSGFSPAIAKMVFSSKNDPFEALLDALNVERYEPVEQALT